MLLRQILLQIFFFTVLLSISLNAQNKITDPYQILSKHYEAIGGLEKIKSEKTLFYEGIIIIKNAGLEGTIKRWEHRPSAFREELDLTVIEQTSGDNGETMWEVDTNGKLRIIKNDAALQRRKIEVLMSGFEHMNPESDYFTLNYLGLREIEGAKYHCIQITNSINSDTIKHYFDTGNFHLIKEVQKQPDKEIHTTYSDYRSVNGIQHSFHREIRILPHNQEQTIQIKDFQTNLEIGSSFFAPPKDDAEDFSFIEGESSENVPFKFIDGHIYLPVKIGCDERQWILDTGASATVVDGGYAKELGLRPEGELKGEGAGHQIDVSFVHLPSLKTSGIIFRDQKVASIDFAEMIRRSTDIEIGGILGYDFLSRFITKIDYANELVSFYDPQKFEYKRDGQIVDATLKGQIMTIPMTVDGKYFGRWSLDLGASHTIFLYPFAQEKGFLNREGIEGIGFGAGGAIHGKAVKFQSADFAGFTIEEPVIGFPLKMNKGAFGSKELIGNIGSSILRHFTLYLDYDNQRIIVEKGADFGSDFPVDRSGLLLMRSDMNDIEVFYVIKNSPAHRSGFQKGDIIEKINDISVAHFDGIVAIRNLFKADAGTQYRITVLHEGKVKSISLVLEDLFK